MNRTLVPTLPVHLDRGVRLPLGVQLADQVRALITAGTLDTGDRLPSTRRLAADLGVSRAVTEQAFDQLLAEGWLEGRRGSGTYVAASIELAPPVRRATTAEPEPAPLRFDTGTPWIDPRHAAGWRRAWHDVANARPPAGYPDARGLPALREALCAHLARTRGLTCSPDEIAITTGTTDGLRHLLGVLPAGSFAVEDPGYRAAVEVAHGLGRTVVDVPVDSDGIAVAALAGAAAGSLAAIYVTPAHQHPLGITMSAATRLALLRTAREAGAMVIEDDYDSEFRYDVAPLPALASLDRDRVAYLGTASKSVAPGLRLGWLVAPVELVGALSEARARSHDLPAWPVQRAYLSMLRDGHVDRLIRSARRTYAVRSARVLDRLGRYGEVEGAPAGMYVTLQLSRDRAEHARRAAARHGFNVPLLADYARSSDRSGLVLGFGGCTDAELEHVLEVLATALGAGAAQR